MSRSYACRTCNKTFGNPLQLSNHRKEVHNETKSYKELDAEARRSGNTLYTPNKIDSVYTSVRRELGNLLTSFAASGHIEQCHAVLSIISQINDLENSTKPTPIPEVKPLSYQEQSHVATA